MARPAKPSEALAKVDLLPLRSIADLNAIGEVFVKSGLFADTRDAAKAMVKILAGREVGLPPFASMTGVNIIQGKPTYGANLMAAVIQRSGTHRFTVTKMSDIEVAIAFFEKIDGAWVSCGPDSTFTHQDAMKCGLFSKQTYKQYPRNMLYARALSNGARWYCAGVFGGPVYVPEEMGAQVDADGHVIAVPVEAGGDVALAAPRPLDVVDQIRESLVVTAAEMLDERFASWRHRPAWSMKFFGEALMEEEALRLFAEQEPGKFAAGLAAIKSHK